MSGVCRSCYIKTENKVDPDLFKKRVPVLSKFIARIDDLELESLYAVQALDHKMKHPVGKYRLESN